MAFFASHRPWSPEGMAALERHGDLARLHALAPQARERNYADRARLAQTLIRLGDPSSVAALSTLVVLEPAWMRPDTLAHLIELGEPTAIPALIRLLEDERESIVAATATGLNQLGWTPTLDDAGARYFAARHDWAACGRIGSPAVSALSRYLDLGEGPAQALAAIGGDAATRTLADRLGDTRIRLDIPAVGALVRALGQLGGPVAQAAITQATRSYPGAADDLTMPVYATLPGADPQFVLDRYRAHERDRTLGPTRGIAIALGLLATPETIAYLQLLHASNDRSEDGRAGLDAIRDDDVARAAWVDLLVERNRGAYISRENELVAVAALDRLGYQPSDDEASIRYLILRGEYARALDLGGRATELLLDEATPEARQALDTLAPVPTKPLADRLRSRFWARCWADLRIDEQTMWLIAKLRAVGSLEQLLVLLDALDDNYYASGQANYQTFAGGYVDFDEYLTPEDLQARDRWESVHQIAREWVAQIATEMADTDPRPAILHARLDAYWQETREFKPSFVRR